MLLNKNIIHEGMNVGDKLVEIGNRGIIGGNIGYNSRVICKDKDGNIVSDQKNTTLYGGRRFILEKLYNKTPIPNQQLTLNTILNINASEAPVQVSDYNNRIICLFGLGIGGASNNFGEVYNPTGNENNLYEIIPLRTVPVGNDLSSAERQQYFMRRKVSIGGSLYYQYFLKKFTVSDINVKLSGANYIPTEEANDPMHDPMDPLSLEAINEFLFNTINVSEFDVKEQFLIDEGNLNTARFNELALYYGIPKTVTVEGETYTDYIMVEAFSKITFNNRPMDTEGAKYDFQYYIIT